MKRKIRWAILALVLIGIVAAIAISAWCRGGSSGRITISKETTYITEPLRPDGYVDYVAALNQRFSEGVTPENNAAVPFWQASGPREIPEAYREKYFQMLGIPPLPEAGDYLSVSQFIGRLKDLRRPADDQPTEGGQRLVWEQSEAAMKEPWSKEEFPALAEALAANEKPLALVVEGCRRSRYYEPFVGETANDSFVFRTSLRDLARVLALRAMLRLGENRSDEAWDDLLACHRLSRLIRQGPSSIDVLIGVTADDLAFDGDKALLRHSQLSAAQFAKIRAGFDQLPPRCNLADRVDFADRVLFLDMVTAVTRDGIDALQSTSWWITKSTAIVIAPKSAINWDRALRIANAVYDRYVAALRIPTRSERSRALNKIKDDLETQESLTNRWGSFLTSMVVNPRRALSDRAGYASVSWVTGNSTLAYYEDRSTVKSDLIRLAFALAAYRADHGIWPQKLADLSPDYVTEVPKDIFADADFQYTVEGNDYLLHSTADRGGDLTIRIPAKEPSPVKGESTGTE